MVRGTVSKQGDGYVITVPREELERLHLRDGQAVLLDVRAAEDGDVTSSDNEQDRERIAWSKLALRSLARDWDLDSNRVYDQLA